MNRLSLAALALMTASVSLNCATTTTITTDQPGAKVVRDSDKKEIGVTPYKYTTSMWLWESEKLTIKSSSGKSKSIELKRSEIDLVPTAGAVALTVCTGCAGVPLFLAGGMKLPEVTKVTFEGDAPAAAAPGATAASFLSPRIADNGNVVY